MILNEELIEQKLGLIEKLPTLPLVLSQIQKVMQNPKSSMAQISVVVAKDQSLASQTIRLVNSAFYGMRERVTSINQALVILGLNTLNSLMIGLSVVKLFRNSNITCFDPQQFWEHCFGTALIAKEIAGVMEYRETDRFFTAGLLHDMGRLVLDQFMHEDFTRAMLASKIRKKPLSLCEKELIGFDHGDAGAWLARKWGLPEMFIVVMEFHNKPDQLTSEQLVFAQDLKIISIANNICKHSGIGSSGDKILVPENLCVMDKLTYKQACCIAEKAGSEVRNTIDEWNKAI
jgi:putative nucleotidyltransferase with HDIG domain